MNSYELTYKRFSESSILVQWPQKISPEILDDLLIFKNYLLSLNNQTIVQITNGYNSLLMNYSFYIVDLKAELAFLKSQYPLRLHTDDQDQSLWKIPVCYDSVFGLDLEEISKGRNLSISEIIRIHSETSYKVYFIGFLPGFLYLGGLDEHLYIPRKKSPRQHIEKGAVAIGGEQTGIYPNASPGGWNIIGNSPLNFFNPKLETPCFANAGDSIQFVPVDFEAHQDILSDVKNGTYIIKSEVDDG